MAANGRIPAAKFHGQLAVMARVAAEAGVAPEVRRNKITEALAPE